MKSILLRYWKRQLRKRYLRYASFMDALPCGRAIAREMNLGRCLVDDLNEAIRNVKSLDPACAIKEFEC